MRIKRRFDLIDYSGTIIRLGLPCIINQVCMLCDRSLPAGETEKQVKMMDDMLACRFSRLPREFFISRFHWEYPTSSRTIGTAASPTAATDNGDNGSTDTLKSPYMRCLAAANVTRLSHLNCFRGYPQVSV